MKQISTLFLLLICFGLNAQNIFVKQNAVGLGDGSSWLNAYTSLDLALSIAAPGQAIWVAGGTYKPTGLAPNNSFYLASGVSLYGGFSGTETALSQRNILANPTILSGDIMGNDVAGNFAINRTDNCQHVIIGFVLTTNLGLVIDGFTIKGGQTLTGAANTDLTRRGGGLLINAKATVRNCTFSDNFGESGAGMAALDALSDQLVVNNCVFEANNATEDAILFLRSTPNGQIKNCIFRNNLTKRGAFYPANSVNMQIDSCLFEKNTGVDYGGAMFTWQSTFTISNTVFLKNKAPNAAGIYIDGRDGGDLATLNNCVFESDSTTGYGGTAIFSWKAHMAINNCTFSNNVAPTSGASMYNGDGSTFLIKGCTFEGNKAQFAGAIANYGGGCIGTFEDCTFSGNSATEGGGALSNGFTSNVTYKNCNFFENSSKFGAAIFTQNVTTELHIEGCLFEGNTATGTAGSVYVNDSILTTIKGTTFKLNTGTYGGALNANGGLPITIDKCQFLENFSTTQGAGINFNAANAVITNCVFAKNFNSNPDGAGGAISNNASENETSTVTAVNCTFADNISGIGAGIGQWENPDFPLTAIAKVTLLNCLFQNPDGENYSIEQGEPEVISLNGNQSSDQTLELYLTQGKDVNNTSNSFQNPDSYNYAHTIGSPASDGGVSAGAPSDDINGVSRAGTPDVGAYEVKTSGTHNIGIQVMSLKCAPNPASDLTVVSLENDQNGAVQISVWNQLGQQMAQYTAEKTASNFTFPLNVTQLAAGTYKVQVRMGGVVHEGAFAKF